MNAQEFRNLYECEFVYTPNPLYEFAKEYHDRCEAYDQTVCSGRREGVAMPVDGHEMCLINRNAQAVRRDIIARNGLDGHALYKAIQEFFKQQDRN